MSSLEYCWEILTDQTSSRNLRRRLKSSSWVATFTYCWVIVEPPPAPPVACLNTARPMPIGSKPGLDQYDRSSAASTASCTCLGTCSSWTFTRFSDSGMILASSVLPSE
jgi:hypothetical protein